MFNWLRATSAAPPAPSAEEEAAAERELHMRDVRCHLSRGDEYWYPRRGDITKPFDDADCIKGQRWRPFLAKKRVDPFALPPLAPFAAQAAAPTLPDHIAVVETAAPTQPAIPPAAPKKRAKHFTRDPGAVDDDPSRFALPSALADYDMALTQDVLYQYARGWLPGARYDRRVDWSALTEPKDAAGAPIMPPGTCGSADMRLKPHQMTVWTVLRAWAARQGSSAASLGAGALPYASDLGSLDAVDFDDAEDLAGGAGLKTRTDRVPIDAGERLLPTEAAAPPPPFDARRSPKGFLVYHSLGSGKTNVTMCALHAFWNQRLTDGTSRPLYVVTSKENKGQMARKGDGSSRYYTAAKGMFPGSLGALSSADFHAGYDILSFNQAGLRLGYPMSDLAEGEAPRRQLERARPDFVARFRNAVILIDEPQGMFAPLPAFRNTNGGLRQWLSSAEADGCTVVLLTATPGKSVAELFTLLNTLKRSDEQLAAADFVAPDGTANAAAFRAAMAGQVSFVELSNNTNDFPSVSVEVVRAPMSSPHFTAWRERALADAREEAAGGAKAWAHLFNKEEYAKTSRAWSNMVYPGSKLKEEGKEGKEGYARDAYKRGQAADVALYSAKLAALATRVDERAPLGKQYLYSAFGEQGIHQIGDVLEARGWTNVSGKLKPLYEAVAALRKAGGGGGGGSENMARALERVQGEVERLPGEPFRRFITTREWRDDAPAAGVGVVREEDEDDAPAKTTEQLMELDAFNALRNSAGDAVNLLIASKKFNEGLDLKAVRTMHIFEPLISVPAEQQTVGRGRRYCSHAVLEPEDRNMLVYHYFSVEPQGQADLVASIEGLEAAARAADADAADADAKTAALQQRVQLLAARAAALSRRPSADAVEAKAKAKTEAEAEAETTEPTAHAYTHAQVKAKPKARRARSPLAGMSDDDVKEVKEVKAVKPKAGAKPKARDKAKEIKAEADADGLVDAMSHMSISGGFDPLAELDLGGGAGDLWALPGAVFKGAAQAAREWWNVGPETAAAAEATAREADAHIAEVRAALFVQERAAEAAERRLADARAAGKEPDLSALVQVDLARDRVRALKEQAAAQAAAATAVAKAVAKDVKAIASKTHADVSAQAVAIQVELKLTLEKLDDEVRRASEARAAAVATRREVAARKARVLPEWRHLIGDAEAVVGTGVGGRVLKRDLEAADKAAQPVMLTDTLIHGISRKEYAPMKVLLQALRDAAIDCRVLHGLHARMGVKTHCAV